MPAARRLWGGRGISSDIRPCLCCRTVRDTPAPPSLVLPFTRRVPGHDVSDAASRLAGTGKPDYTSIDNQIQSKVLTATIRKLLIREVGGKDSDPRPWTNFDALMTPVRCPCLPPPETETGSPSPPSLPSHRTPARRLRPALTRALRPQRGERHGRHRGGRPEARAARLHGHPPRARHAPTPPPAPSLRSLPLSQLPPTPLLRHV